MLKYILSATLCLAFAAVFAQGPRTWTIVQRTGFPTIDGQLNDSCWQSLPPLDEFITSQPVFGAVPKCRTEVRLFYTPAAIWLGVHCFDPDPGTTRRDLGVRDQAATGDWFQVQFDTWNDDQLSFSFAVTAGGVQLDSRQFRSNWDASWRSAVLQQADGWTLEICIPFSALRFPRKSEQTWGLQLTRYDRSTGESSTWNPQNPLVNDNAWQFGTLTGLHDLRPQRRRSLAIHSNTNVSTTNKPFKVSGLQQSAGIDGRIGLTESATLDFTILPTRQLTIDWGSIFQPVQTYISSEAELPAPRQFLEEERDLFDKTSWLTYNPMVSGYTMSWRRPLTADERFYNFTTSKLLQATKLSARTKGNWRFGVFNALLGPAKAEIINWSTFEKHKETLQTVSNYNFLTAEYLLPNNGYINISNTNLLAGPGFSTLSPQLSLRLRDRSNAYELRGNTRYSYQNIDTAYWQGYNYDFALSRINRRWGWTLAHFENYRNFKQPAGDVPIPRRAYSRATVNFRDFQPHGVFQNIYGQAGVRVDWMGDPEYGNDWSLNADLSALDRRFRLYNLNLSGIPYARLVRYSRGGAYIDQKISPTVGGGLQFNSDARKSFLWNAGIKGTVGLAGEFPTLNTALGATWVINPHLAVEGNVRTTTYFGRLSLLTAPGRWLFERADQVLSQFNAGLSWYPVSAMRLYVYYGANGSRLYRREAVELQNEGKLTPVNEPLDAYRPIFDGQLTLGFQWYFTPMSQLRFHHAFGPQNTYLSPIFPAVQERFTETNLSVIYFFE